MPDYIVKTTDGRNLVIAAERYTYSEGTGDYQFYAPNSPAQPVASVPKEGVFAVVEFDTSLQADFYDDPDTSLLDSQEFVDAVSDIVDVWHEDLEDAEDQPADPEKPRVYFARRKGGTEWGNCWQGGSWGFDTPGGFAPFPNKEIAELYLSQAEFTSFYTVPLEEVEEVHE